MKLESKKTAFDYVLMVLFCGMIVMTVYPFLNVLAISLNDPMDTMRNVNFVIPRQFTLANYQFIFSENNMMQPMIMSVVKTLVGTGLGVIFTAMLAYVLSRKDFYFNKSFTIIFSVTMYVSGGMIPEYLLIMRTLRIGLVVGQGIAITTACKYPVEAIKFIDFLCSDEGQVLTNWGIKDVNYFVDENGKRYRTPEEVEEANSNQNYRKETGVGQYNYPFPAYGTGVLDATGNTYTTASKEAVITEYNAEQKAACEAWGVDLLLDIFPQKDEFEIPEFPPIWAYIKPAEFTDLNNKLDEVAWSSLITCVIGKPEAFDANYDAMLSSLEATGMSRAEEILTGMVKDKVALVED